MSSDHVPQDLQLARAEDDDHHSPRRGVIESLGTEGVAGSKMFSHVPYHLRLLFTQTVFWNSVLMCATCTRHDRGHDMLCRHWKKVCVDETDSSQSVYASAWNKRESLVHAVQWVYLMGVVSSYCTVGVFDGSSGCFMLKLCEWCWLIWMKGGSKFISMPLCGVCAGGVCFIYVEYMLLCTRYYILRLWMCESNIVKEDWKTSLDHRQTYYLDKVSIVQIYKTRVRNSAIFISFYWKFQVYVS